VRSSRQLESHCHEDLAFRVLAGNHAPDHVTIARFRARYQEALADFLVVSLRLCAAGLVRLGLIALDGTKVAANAASHTLDKIETEVAEILQQVSEPTSVTTWSTARPVGGRAPGGARQQGRPADAAHRVACSDEAGR
jgi:hypothetical protein